MARVGSRFAGWALLVLAVGACRSQDHAPPVQNQATDWNVVIAGLEADLRAAMAQPSAADVRDSNLPLAALEIEKMQLRLADRWRDARWLAQQRAGEQRVREALQRFADGAVALAGQTGADSPTGYLERAYLCRTDGSPQPYFVRLPDDYTPERAWPLVIFLHGYVPETSKIDPWVLPAHQWTMAARRGLILVMPHGRRNSDFLGIGEVDALRVLEEMRRWYRIDPDRVFMTGCSMGGYGGWALGLRHPDEFAGLALMAGQTDFFVWERRARDETRFKSWCILQNNPIDLAVNALHLPSLVQHGELDPLVPVVHSRLMVPELQRLGYETEYHEIKGAGHYIYWEDEPFERMFDWCAARRRDPHPREVRFKTYTTRYGRCYWLTIRRFQQWGEAGEVRGRVLEDRVEVTADNVAELWIDLPAALADRPLSLMVNGRPAGQVGVGPHRVRIGADGVPTPAEPAPAPEEPPVTGPAREVFNRAFRVVAVSGGDPALAEHNRARAEAFGRTWYAFAEGLLPPPAVDAELTEEDVRTYNLVIFGEPGNARLAGIPDPVATLPRGLVIEPGRYTVGSHTYSGGHLGGYFLQRHPLNPQGLILWCSGVEYGAGLPVNHQFDLLPDLLVYTDQIGPDGANVYRIGGFLNQDGELDEALLDPAPDAGA